MITRILSAGFMLGLLTMIFYTPAIMAKGIMQLEYENLTLQERIICKIPILNIAKAERIYTGRISFIAVSTVAVIVLTILRFVVVFVCPGLYAVQLITVILFLLSIVAFFVTNMYLVFMVLNDVDTRGLGAKIAYAVVFPMGQFYIGTYLPTELRNLAKEEEVFK